VDIPHRDCKLFFWGTSFVRNIKTSGHFSSQGHRLKQSLRVQRDSTEQMQPVSADFADNDVVSNTHQSQSEDSDSDSEDCFSNYEDYDQKGLDKDEVSGKVFRKCAQANNGQICNSVTYLNSAIFIASDSEKNIFKINVQLTCFNFARGRVICNTW
jgi:hypothetical protein